jgi:hypothetical protein
MNIEAKEILSDPETQFSVSYLWQSLPHFAPWCLIAMSSQAVGLPNMLTYPYLEVSWYRNILFRYFDLIRVSSAERIFGATLSRGLAGLFAQSHGQSHMDK